MVIKQPFLYFVNYFYELSMTLEAVDDLVLKYIRVNNLL